MHSPIHPLSEHPANTYPFLLSLHGILQETKSGEHKVKLGALIIGAMPGGSDMPIDIGHKMEFAYKNAPAAAPSAGEA